MLEVVNVIGNYRQGEAKISGDTAYQGYIGYIAGVDSNGTPIIKMPYNTAQAFKAYYPIKKLRMEEDLSDTSDAVDLLTNGDRIVYYEGGEFWTDKISRSALSFGKAMPAATAFGRFVDIFVHTVAPTVALYVNYGYNRGQLIGSATGTQAGWYNNVAPKKFTLVEAYGASASGYVSGVERGTTLKARFKIQPGYVGMVP